MFSFLFLAVLCCAFSLSFIFDSYFYSVSAFLQFDIFMLLLVIASLLSLCQFISLMSTIMQAFWLLHFMLLLMIIIIVIYHDTLHFFFHFKKSYMLLSSSCFGVSLLLELFFDFLYLSSCYL